MKRPLIFLLATSLTSLATACLPSGSNGGGGGVTIIDDDAGSSADMDDSNNTGGNNAQTKTCSDGSVVPLDQPCNCPQSAADCDDGDPCTQETFVSGDTCGTCSATTINTCGAIDGCCPAICSVDNDNDCGGCGNGRVEDGETCDGDCPFDAEQCPEPVEACQRATITGAPEACNAACSFEPITECGGFDGCCPSGCGPDEDDDCYIEHGGPCADAPLACRESHPEGFCITADFFQEGVVVSEDGFCSSFDCASTGACSNGSQCVQIDDQGSTICLFPCTTNNDCPRTDMTCQDGGGGQGFCF